MQKQAQIISIQNTEGVLTVSSREVAGHFEKEHSKVLRSIEAIQENQPSQNWTGYFISAEYKDLKGEMRKGYLLTRDGFTLLVMGFTGTKALEWKLKYIEAFNKMEKSVKQIPQRSSFGDLAALMKEWRQWAKSMNMPPYMAMKELVKFLKDKGEPVPNTWAYLPQWQSKQMNLLEDE